MNELAEELRGVVREVVAERSGDELWKTAAELGWLGLEIPEAHGGSGMGFDLLAPVLDELGRGLASIPFVSSVVLGAAALRFSPFGDEWLPAIASGEKRVAVALDPYVLDAVDADAVLVVADDRMHLATVTVTAVPTYDVTRRLAEVRVDELGEGFGDAALIAWLRERAAVALALDSHGGARRAMEITVEYAKQRMQFGRPIGSFQAVKHHCANMFVAVETTKVAADTAVREIAGEPGHPTRWSSIAKAHAADAYVDVASLGIAVHGGIGFTWEHDMHRFLERARLDQALFGTSAWHRDRIAS